MSEYVGFIFSFSDYEKKLWEAKKIEHSPDS